MRLRAVNRSHSSAPDCRHRDQTGVRLAAEELPLNVALNNRAKQQDGTWTDGPTSFYRVTTFGARAKNAGNSFHQGEAVLVAGNLTVQGFTRADGTNGLTHEITAEHLGASVLYGTVAISKTTKADSAE